MIMNDISQPQYLAMSGIDSGAASAPTDEPELKIAYLSMIVESDYH